MSLVSLFRWDDPARVLAGAAVTTRTDSALASLLADALLEADSDLDVVADHLHDGPAQDAIAARYAAELLQRGDVGPEEVLAPVRSTSEHLRGCITGLRSHGRDGDLAAVLRGLADGHDDRQLVLSGTPAAAEPAVATLVYRVACAALGTGGGRLLLTSPSLPVGPVLVLSGLAPESGYAAAARFRHRTAALGIAVSTATGALRLQLPSRRRKEHS